MMSISITRRRATKMAFEVPMLFTAPFQPPTTLSPSPEDFEVIVIDKLLPNLAPVTLLELRRSAIGQSTDDEWQG
jgi:hypothetical protein